MEFSRPEYRSGYLSLLQGNVPNPEIEPRSPTLQADSLPAELHGMIMASVHFSSVQLLSHVQVFATPSHTHTKQWINSEFTFNKGLRTCQWEKNNLLNKYDCTTRYPHAEGWTQTHPIYYTQKLTPGQNTGVGSLSLLQGIFPTQGSNPGLPHCRQILCQLSPHCKR